MVSATRTTLGLLAAVALGACLRLFRAGQNSLWIDELASLQVALRPLADIPAAALHGNAFEPPVYFWLLHGVVSLIGISEPALRALSIAAGVLTIPVTWLLVRELTARPGTATLVALLLAINPLHIWYSQEARPYALMLLLGVGSLLCFRWAARTASRSAWAGYAVLSALTILSQAAGIVVPAVAALWVALSRSRREIVASFATASLGTVVLVAPFVVALASSVEPGSTGSPPRALTWLEGPYTIFTYVAGYSFGPSVREIQDYGWRMAVERNSVQTAVATVMLVVIAVLALRARSEAMWLLGALVAVPVGMVILGSGITTKAYNVRYTLPALIGFLGVAGVAAAGLRPGVGRVYVGALVLVSLWADAQWFFVPRYWKEDSKAAIACLTGRVEPGSTVAVAPAYMRGLLDHYASLAGTSLSIVGLSAAEDLTHARPAALLTTRLHHADGAAELVRTFRGGDAGPVAEGEVPGYRIYLRLGDRPVEAHLACEASP